MIRGLGRHIIAEFHECDAKTLKDEQLIKNLLTEAANASKSHILSSFSVNFGGEGGVSAILIIQESHISIHTWPEHNYAAVDIFTCGEKTDPVAALEVIANTLKPRFVNTMEVKRGVLTELRTREAQFY
ncbi:MAG TPA: adenosylmethionine decarboxylase [Candidatus Caldiarchaeum subterraneum]|uniref:S-adenosylmethionine decarboxylase proenzyme n=1 Tax=Caldiarchaeum subterraneum TaxID=311458 RepID=A0A833EBK8_CALS0|nr:adenosylmethionine decarboxylase [Aigarchaeota archaeon]HIQ29359.1 adenosylmethionine decarboxylase [Candidatus Caldarchaeum subterraneum]